MSLPSFATRAAPHTLLERMDSPSVDAVTFTACLKSLASVNRMSFGYAPTVRFTERLAERRCGPLRILDVGSGYGDTLRAVARRLVRRGITAELVGADLNPHAAAAAPPFRQQGVSVRFLTRDARDLAAGERWDAVISSLFTHHLEDDEVTAFLAFMDGAAPAWFVNDLYRSRFAAVGFGLLATLTAKHPFVRHDGPVSFARAFRRADWEAYLTAAGVSGARIFIGAPFRLCVEKLP